MCETTEVPTQTAGSGGTIINGDVNITLNVSLTLPDLLSPEHMMQSLDDFLASMAGDEGPTSISEAVQRAMDMAQSLGVPMQIMGGDPGVLDEIIAAIHARKGGGRLVDLNAMREHILRQREQNKGEGGCGGCGCGCGGGAKEAIVDDPGSEAAAAPEPPGDAAEPPAQPGEVPSPQGPATPADAAGEE